MVLLHENLMTDTTEPIRVLHVDDDRTFGRSLKRYFERNDDELIVFFAESAIEAQDVLAEEEIDCIVSDYDMDEMTGLEFLKNVRDDSREIPFILFTGKGSEEIASQAITAGVTDYLQKETGLEQFSILAMRIKNAVGQHRFEKEIQETQERFQLLIEASTDVVSIVDPTGRFQYLSPSSKQILGYEPGELLGEVGFDYTHPDDQERAMVEFAEAVLDPDRVPIVEFRFKHPEKSWIWVEAKARNLVDHPLIGGLVIHTRDVSDRKQREQELEQQNEWMGSIVNTVTDDLKTPLHDAQYTVDVVRETENVEELDTLGCALGDMEYIVDNFLNLALQRTTEVDIETVALGDVLEEAWTNVHRKTSTFETGALPDVVANRTRLRYLFENLFRNAIDHGGPSVGIRVGPLEDGFYVEDDGRTISPADREAVFDAGYTTRDDGFGYGLTIVKGIVDSHGWEIEITAGKSGGTRFEITNVELVE